MSYREVLQMLGSEAVLAVTALVVLGLDLARGRDRALPARRQLAALVTLLGLAGAALALVPLLRLDGRALINDTVVVSPLTVMFKFVLIVLAVFTVVISADQDLGRHVGEYFAMLVFATMGALLLVGTEELLTLFVALELMSISLYVLTAFHKDSLRSQEAALKYFLFGAVASAFLLFGLSYIVGVTGATRLREVGEFVAARGVSPLVGVGLLCVLVGLGFKVAVVPFHLWAPDTYEGAPTPVTAFIATASKVASFFVLVKFLLLGFGGAAGSAYWRDFQSGWAMVLGVVAAASMVLGNVAAIVQTNVKRLLAYSSIAHAGYILIGLVAGSGPGAAAVLFYVVVYALTNLGAFGVVGALAARGGGEGLENFNGMARRSPYLSLLLLVFLLSLAGVPPLGGFFGKFYLFATAVQRDAQGFGLLWLVVLGIVMSAVSLYYYLIVLKHVYVAPARDNNPVGASGMVNVALGLLALAVVAMGVWPEPILALLKLLVSRL